jgi:diadenosine tetraphosphate (Ap4A) HIT family hydrolase
VSFDFADAGADDCVFCSIVAGESEAKWEVNPSSGSKVACFHNRLTWVRVMLLIVPIEHMTQREFWTSDTLREAAEMAVEMGDAHCSTEGYRIISNFGLQAHQSQSHAHLHVISGESSSLRDGTQKLALNVASDFSIDEFDIAETPFAARISPSSALSQRDLWKSDRILEAASTAAEVARTHSPNGFRLMSSFEPATADDRSGSNPAGLFLLGGGQLGLYGSSY